MCVSLCVGVTETKRSVCEGGRSTNRNSGGAKLRGEWKGGGRGGAFVRGVRLLLGMGGGRGMTTPHLHPILFALAWGAKFAYRLTVCPWRCSVTLYDGGIPVRLRCDCWWQGL